MRAPSLLLDMLLHAEGVRSFPPHVPNPPMDNSSQWRVCDHGQTTGPGVLFSSPCPATGSVGGHMLVTTGWLHLTVLQLLANRLEIKLPLFCPFSALSTEVMSCWHRDYFCICTEHSRDPACPLGFYYNSDYSKGNFKTGGNICFQAGSITCSLSASTRCTREESVFETQLGLETHSLGA